MSNWNQRFGVSTSKDNQNLHDYYREYFDKPSRSRVFGTARVKVQRLLDPPNLRATLGFDFQRMPSRIISRESRSKEALWDNRFNVMWSKDNPHIHKSAREYFDRPKDLEFRRDVPMQDLPKLYRASTYVSLRSSASRRSMDVFARKTWAGR